MAKSVPILLSFFALSNGSKTMIHGQLSYTGIRDLSFREFSRRRTFRTLLSLYRTKPYARRNALLIFENDQVEVSTDKYGAFYLNVDRDLSGDVLQHVHGHDNVPAKMVDGLYQTRTQKMSSDVIVISDIDDTLLHSFIYRKLRKFRTLMFTKMEKRKAVVNMFELMSHFSSGGAASFYLSNSEQNLYPLIYSFLLHNKFPEGPIFLKKLRGLWDVIRNVKKPLKNLHKQQVLEEVLTFFPDKKFVLMGDNTQHDLLIYLTVAADFPERVSHIIIRKVVDKAQDQKLLAAFSDKPTLASTKVYYADKFPATLEL